MLVLPSASIVLCTYQGGRFLREQLHSLSAQTVQPQEIIAHDDASTDQTLSILEEWKKSGLGASSSIFQNEQRLGFAENFALALSKVKCEIVFYCDQDDVWDPKKLETMLTAFAKNPGLTVAFSDASFIDQNGKKLPGYMLERNGFGMQEADLWQSGKAFPFLIRRNPVAGMSMAFRRSHLPNLLPIPFGWEHDYWTLLLAAGLGKPFHCDRGSLVMYRQHQHQAVGGKAGILRRILNVNGQSISKKTDEAERVESLIQRLEQSHAPQENQAMAREKKYWLLERSRFPRLRLFRFVPILFGCFRGHYHRFEAGFSTAVKDWLSPY